MRRLRRFQTYTDQNNNSLVILGQFFLIPLVAAPRLVFDGPRIRENRVTSGYVAELLASAAVAIAVGLALRQV